MHKTDILEWPIKYGNGSASQRMTKFITKIWTPLLGAVSLSHIRQFKQSCWTTKRDKYDR